MEATVTALEMRRKFGSILDRVLKKGDHITIMRGDKPLAVLIPVEEHERHYSKQERLKKIEEVMLSVDEWKRRNPKLAKKMAKTDSAKLVRQMRDSRYGR